MAGLCGWYLTGGAEDPAHCIDTMAHELSEYDGASVSSATGEVWGLALASVLNPVALYQADGEVVAVHGRPELVGTELKENAGRLGLGKAIADAYRRQGHSLLEHIQGRFALAIGLTDERRLLLAVDRCGVETMYFAPVRDGAVFATRLPALKRHPDVGQDIDFQTIFNYLYFHAIPSPDCIYEGVRRLPAGGYAEFSEGSLTESRYWSIQFSNETAKLPFADLKSEFMDILRADVAAYIESGRNIGCFLSGGTDSSTVAGLLTELGGSPAQTYSIGFDEPGFDEMEYARIASRFFGTEHHEYYVTPNDVAELIPKIPRIYGEPFGNSSAVPSYYCAAMARQDGIDTLLAGDGGDELFGGNARYAKQEVFGLYEKIPETLRDYLIEPAVFGFPLGQKILPIRKAQRYIEQAKMPMPGRMWTYNLLDYIGIGDIFSPDFLDRIDSGIPLSYLSAEYGAAAADTMMNKMSASDIRFTLADNDLPKVTRMCELAGVTVGFPFLSDSLVEFSARLPAALKVRNFKLRYFFKEALRDFLPPEVLGKSKHGFGLPVGRWLVSDNRLRQLASDSLTNSKQLGVFRSSFIDDLIDNKLSEHPDFYGTLVWVIMILEHWYRDQRN